MGCIAALKVWGDLVSRKLISARMVNSASMAYDDYCTSRPQVVTDLVRRASEIESQLRRALVAGECTGRGDSVANALPTVAVGAGSAS